MSSVKIVFSDVVGGSAVASQIRELVSQLTDYSVLSIGDMKIAVDSVFASEHLTNHGFKPTYVVKGRVMEKPANKPE